MANTVTVGLLADVSKATKEINSFISGTTKVLLGFGVSFAAVFGGAKVIESALESENAINKLNTALKLSGDFSDEASKSFQALGKDLQATGLFSDEAALGAAALAKQFNVTNDQAKQLVKAAADLSAQTGKDLNDSVRLLGQSMDGTAGKLTELVPATRALTVEQLRSGEAIKLVAERFKGAAEAAGSTFSGSIGKAKLAFGDIFEEIGKVIIQNPLVIKLLSDLGGVFQKLAAFLEKNSAAMSQFVTDGILFLAKGLPIVIGLIGELLKPIKFVLLGFNSIREAVHGTILELIQGSDLIKTALAVVIRVLAQAAVGVLTVVKAFAELGPVSSVLKKAGINVEGLSKGLDTATDAAFQFQDSVTEENMTGGIQALIDANLGAEKGLLDTFSVIDSGLQSAQDRAAGFALELDNAAKEGKKAGKDIGNSLGQGVKQALDPKEVKALFESIGKNPLQILIDPKVSKLDPVQVALAGGAGAISQILDGAKGAVNLFSTGLGAVADSFIPGIGGAVGKIVEVLAKGPEEVKKMIREFFQAIPQIVVNIAKAVPALITEIVAQVPILIQALIDALPEVILALVAAVPDLINAVIAAVPQIIFALAEAMPLVVSSLIDQLPMIIEGFVQGLIENAPKFIEGLVLGIPRFIEGFIQALPQIIQFLIFEMPKIIAQMQLELIKALPGIAKSLIDSLINEGKRFIQSLIDAIPGLGSVVSTNNGGGGLVGNLLPFADGGQVPGGAPFNDRVPSVLTPNETVIDRGLTDDLKALVPALKALASGGVGGGGGNTQVTAVIQMSEERLASAIFNINRQGFRTS